MPTLAHKIRLMPTPDQVQYFKRACSTARSVRNWGWVEWDRQRAAGQKPTAFSLKMPFNARARWPRSRNGEKAQRGVARAHLRGQHPPGVLAQDPHPSLSRNPRDRDGNVVGAGDAGESSVGPGRRQIIPPWDTARARGSMVSEPSSP